MEVLVDDVARLLCELRAELSNKTAIYHKNSRVEHSEYL